MRRLAWHGVLLVLAAAPAALAFYQDGATKSDSANWQVLDAGYFSVHAPPGWKFHKLQGIDSYVGSFVGDGIRLDFDFGDYSNPLDEATAPTYVISEENVGGFRARIVHPKQSGHGVTGIYFFRILNRKKLTIEGNDLASAQQELVLNILRSIRFKSSGITSPS